LLRADVVAVWLSCDVFEHTNKVTLRRAGLVLRWVTVLMQRLRSVTSLALVGCRTLCSTIGDRASAAATPGTGCLEQPARGCAVKCQCQMSKTFIGGTVCREFESEAPAAEEMLD